jgi:hypothetical protein
MRVIHPQLGCKTRLSDHRGNLRKEEKNRGCLLKIFE